MTITVDAQPDFAPPRVRIDVNSGAGTVMQSVAVYRETAAGRELLHEQPEAGFDSRSVFDYQMPYETPVTYSWEATYVDPTLFTPSFSEDWSNLTAWSGDVGIASVSDGEVTLTPFLGGQNITHTETIAWDRLTVNGISGGQAGVPSLTFSAAGKYLDFGVAANGTLAVNVINGQMWDIGTTTIDPSQPFTVTRTSTGLLVQGVGGEKTMNRLSGAFEQIAITASTDAPPTVVGPITMSTAGASVTISATADPVTIVSEDGWLIHPASPAKSVPIGFDDMQRTSIRAIGPVTQRSNTTLHRVLGSAKAIPVTASPREADQVALFLVAETAEYEVALRAILADETPLLVTTPPSWDIGFWGGFYAVGDVTIERLVQLYGHPQREFTLPLTSVARPAVTQQNAGWSWAALAAEFPTWADVYAAYETWADVLVDNRKPGY